MFTITNQYYNDQLIGIFTKHGFKKLPEFNNIPHDIWKKEVEAYMASLPKPDKPCRVWIKKPVGYQRDWGINFVARVMFSDNSGGREQFWERYTLPTGIRLPFNEDKLEFFEVKNRYNYG